MHAALRLVLLPVAFFVAAVFQTETVSLVSYDVANAARSGFAEAIGRTLLLDLIR